MLTQLVSASGGTAVPSGQIKGGGTNQRTSLFFFSSPPESPSQPRGGVLLPSVLTVEPFVAPLPLFLVSFSASFFSDLIPLIDSVLIIFLRRSCKKQSNVIDSSCGWLWGGLGRPVGAYLGNPVRFQFFALRAVAVLSDIIQAPYFVKLFTQHHERVPGDDLRKHELFLLVRLSISAL